MERPPRDVDDIHKRLKWCRLTYRPDLTSAKKAADAMDGPATSSYQSHENGHRGVTLDAAAYYAGFYKVDFAWLGTGKGFPRGKSQFLNRFDLMPQLKQRRVEEYMDLVEKSEV